MVRWHIVFGSKQQPNHFSVHSIKHVLTMNSGKNIVQAGLNLQPLTGDRSPAFEADVVMTWSEALEVLKR